MAKEQGLSLNPTKISGSCGRLMCCLKYEQDAYEYLNSFTPHVGATVKTENGTGVVTDVNLITGNLYVKPLDSDLMPFKTHRDNVKVLNNGKKKPKSDN
jgi:cell fate regulator YaaT (PSP1 superfamily)